MDQIAYIFGVTFLYWNSIILAMAVLTGVCFFLCFYFRKGSNALTAACAVPLCLTLGLLLSRFVHWYCRGDIYDGLLSAMTDYSVGGYTLLGAFFGCMIAAVILRLTGVSHNLPQLLDSLSLAGAGTIAVGRLAAFYTTADRGQILTNFTRLPIAYPVTNSITGAAEYRLATFVFQAVIAGIIFLALGWQYIRRAPKLKDGDTTLLFMLAYGASQVIMDSTRYDSLYLRSNGFVSAVQIAAAIALVIPIVIFSIRFVKISGFHIRYVGIWISVLALIGGAGYMEYYVQRHGNQAIYAYTIMAACLCVIVSSMVSLWKITARRERRRAAGTL